MAVVGERSNQTPVETPVCLAARHKHTALLSWQLISNTEVGIGRCIFIAQCFTVFLLFFYVFEVNFCLMCRVEGKEEQEMRGGIDGYDMHQRSPAGTEQWIFQ